MRSFSGNETLTPTLMIGCYLL